MDAEQARNIANNVVEHNRKMKISTTLTAADNLIKTAASVGSFETQVSLTLDDEVNKKVIDSLKEKGFTIESFGRAIRVKW